MKPGDAFEYCFCWYTILAIGVDEIIVFCPYGALALHPADEIFVGF